MNMQLTPEQQEQVRQAKAAGERRVYLRFTPEQRNEWRAAVEEEMAAKEENIAHLRKIHAAAEQPGFFGDLRRAVLASRRPVHELAQQVGVDPRLFSDFQAGEAELPSAALERLVVTLDLRLMQEITR
jgi:DNA-binding MarR family transcriptional regulator